MFINCRCRITEQAPFVVKCHVLVVDMDKGQGKVKFVSISSKYRGPVHGVSVRRARHDDYDAVLDIDRNIYDVGASNNLKYMRI